MKFVNIPPKIVGFAEECFISFYMIITCQNIMLLMTKIVYLRSRIQQGNIM